MGIGDEIPACLSLDKHLPEDLPMALGWDDQPGTGLIHPALHPVDGLVERQRLNKHPSVGADSNKR
jgi:hypothetical protein